MIRITTLGQLYEAAQERRCVLVTRLGGCRIPAAFVLNMQGGTLHWFFKEGIYLYQKNVRKPVALLEEGFPIGTHVIAQVPGTPYSSTCEVLRVEGDMAYVWTHCGTGFVPKHLIRKDEYYYQTERGL